MSSSDTMGKRQHNSTKIKNIKTQLMKKKNKNYKL